MSSFKNIDNDKETDKETNTDPAFDQLLTNINKKPLKEKKSTINKNCCTAAVRYSTIGNAYRDIDKNIQVYLTRDENSKLNAYSRCSKTTKNGEIFCHIHLTASKNKHKIKIFEKDILPTDINDKNRWLANINDPYFEEMGKRGAKKKFTDNNYLFSDLNHPILRVLNHKNVKLSTLLSIYASQLLKGNLNNCDVDTEFNKLTSKNTIKKEENSLDNLISLITSNDSPQISESIEIPLLESSNEEISIDSDTIESEEESDQESDQESISCIPINTKDNEELWYNPDNKTVYKMCDENGDGTELGILKEVSKDYYFIKHEKKYYTVIVPFKSKENNSSFKCIFTNALFDSHMNFIEII